MCAIFACNLHAIFFYVQILIISDSGKLFENVIRAALYILYAQLTPQDQ